MKIKIDEIEDLAIEILKEANGKYLLPYQIFNKDKAEKFPYGKSDRKQLSARRFRQANHG